MESIIHFFGDLFSESRDLLLAASLYVLFGILVGGLLKVFLSPALVANHLGRGRLVSVIKAALLGIPIPLCSCGVLPAAASLKRQGANKGATMAFLMSTPESGIDSMAITYALLDPIMTVARPVSAFLAAVAAGVAENLFPAAAPTKEEERDLTCPVDGCCDGRDCSPQAHKRHHTAWEKLRAGLRFSITELWDDLAGWFLLGILIGGLITVLVPSALMTHYLGRGLPSMLVMLLVGIPIYVCATASTPIAAALILKGASPGAALVFLLVGPATNVVSLTLLFSILGKRATAIYLLTLSCFAVFCGLTLDQVYAGLSLTAHAIAGQAADVIPLTFQWAAAIVLLSLSIHPILRRSRRLFRKRDRFEVCTSCDCSPKATPSIPDHT
ncbi:MAG: SO_0444 family Cu/Zn efflux transporter [Thermodesulfobacteriota bacterium]|nr:SO_0444 family Cu/Zn efflux transporter [Thermodesulfobacteriota bacterium]